MNKNNLDERQEQLLLNLEHNCCWIAYWGLLAVMVIQLIIYGFDAGRLFGEWLIFMIMCIYLAYTCTKNGIWDRRLKPNAKTNLIVSLVAAVIFGAVIAATLGSRYDAEVLDYVISFAVSTVIVFILCFAALTVSAMALKKRQAKLESEEEE